MTAFVPSHGPDQMPEKSVNLQVMLLFENIRAGLRAKQAFDHLLAELEIEANFRFEPVSFDILRDDLICQSMAHAAASADIVVVAGDVVDLPAHVEKWLVSWMAGRTHVTAALVISMDERFSDGSNAANFLHQIMKLVNEPGVSVFHHFAHTPTEPHPSLCDAWRKPQETSPTGQGTLCRSESPRFRA
jgi:hypothetical protein